MKTKLHVLLLLLGLTLSRTLVAQGVTTASMDGTVRDNSNNPLPGANIIAIHMPSGSQYGTISNNDGFFNIQNMRTGGPYLVKISFIGYADQEVKDVFLQLGQNYRTNVKLSSVEMILKEASVLVNKNALISSDRMGASLNLNNKDILELPTISRDINDFTRLTPQSNGSSFAGRDNRFNNYTIDGNIYNNNFGLGSGQFAGGNPISIDAIEEIQVNLAPFDVRQGGFTGANVNAITRSGTNKFEGSVYSFYRNQSLTGSKVSGEDLNTSDSRNRIAGVRFGGPIIKNKLFFFTSFEFEDQLNPGDNRRAARPGLDPDGLTVSRVPASQLDEVSTRMRELYRYETGDYENKNFGSNAYRINLRLDYNISNKHKAFVRFNNFQSASDVKINGNSLRYLPGSLRYVNTNRFGIEAMNFQNSDYTVDRNITSVVGELNSILTNKLSNSINIGYTSIRDPKRGIPNGQAFPFIEVLEPDASGNLLYYMSLGNELFSVGNLLENQIFNISDNITYYHKKHAITAGFNYEMMSFQNAFNPAFNGFYRFNSYQSFYDAVINQDPSVRPDAFAQGYAFDGSNNPPVDAINFSQLGIYVQDKLQLNDKLSLTAGLRVDLPSYPSDLPKNERIEEIAVYNPITKDSLNPNVSKLPKVNPLFSPRIGFNYNPKDDNSIQIRGGVGVFSGRLPFVWISNQVNGNGVTRGGYGLRPNEWGENGNPTWDGFQSDVQYYRPDPGNLQAQLTREVNVTDENFKLPQILRANIAADFNLKNGYFLTFEGIFSKDLSTPISINMATATADTAWSGVDNRPVWSSAAASTYGYFNNAFLLTNAVNNGDYYAMTVQLRKEFKFGPKSSLSTMAAYTRSRARDYGLEGGSQAASLWSTTVQEDRNNPEISFTRFDQPNRLLSSVAFNYKGFVASVLYIGGEAGRYSYTYAGTIGDGQNRLMYIPASRDEIRLVDLTDNDNNLIASADAQWESLNNFIENDAYLSANRGSVAVRNGAKLPIVHRFDVRLLQNIPLSKNKKQKLQLTLDVLNIGNMLNNGWGVNRIAASRQLLRYRGMDTDGVPRFSANFQAGTKVFPSQSFLPLFDISQVWSAQIGVRYSF